MIKGCVIDDALKHNPGPIYACLYQLNGLSSVGPFGTQLLPDPMLTYSQLDLKDERTRTEFGIEIRTFSFNIWWPFG